MRPRIRCLLAMAACLVATTVAAQPVAFLRVEPVPGAEPRIALVEFDPTTGEGAELGDALGHAGWLYGLGEHGSHNYTALLPEDVGTLRASELLAGSQAVLFGVERRERVMDMEAADFARLAGRAGVEWAPRAAGGAHGDGDADVVRVRRIEASKAIVRTDQPEGLFHSTIVTAKRGERAEIRPLFDPTMLQPGPESILPVRVYTEGDGAKGATVIATHVETGAEQRVDADDKAIAILTLDRPGAWRVEFHVASQAPPEDADSEWVVYSATLSFEVIGGGR